CYWKTSGNLDFQGLTFREWQQKGRDLHSIIEDPGFRDPEHYDFTLKTKQIIRKIRFKPYNYTKSGIYGQMKPKSNARISTSKQQPLESIDLQFYNAVRANLQEQQEQD